ncbi:MAG: DUF4166 domain-containing protein [Salinibacterium sp.]|nr:MAG: DUF4166 domain-containing protein [Salinibacterium sp.]
MSVDAVSPWVAAFGERRFELHPRLQTYFSQIPDGKVGRGHGTFDTVGTPRRWLWPLFAMLQRAGILFPVWQRDVPFTVVNSPLGSRLGHVRIFHLAGGDRTMVDTLTFTDGELVDLLGHRARVECALDATIVDGGLIFRSTRIRLRLGALKIRVPNGLVRVIITERYDDARDQQVMSLVMSMPLIGRIYEYGGSFDYDCEEAA